MKRWLFIVSLFAFTISAFAQDEMRTIDSLESVMAKQEGREKVETMIELSRAFFDFSFDDCIAWSEKAIRLSKEIGDTEIEADANYSLGIHYGYHSDLDLSQLYLKKALDIYMQSGNEIKAFESLWNIAYFELLLGNMDTAYTAYQKVVTMAERLNDSLAYAQAISNIAAVQYQRDDIEGSIESFLISKAYYNALHDTAALAEVDMNLATVYGECGRINEARELFVSVIPMLEALRNYDFLLLAYKNYGLLFTRDMINYDSANYYFVKALAVTEMEGVSRQDRQTMANTKADVLTELGNLAFAKKNYQDAVFYYEKALSLAESNGYHFGQMQAMLGFGQLYAKMGQAAQSLRYLERYTDEVKHSGITLMESAVKKSLIIDYARLGLFSEMEKELEILDEQRADLARENVDLYKTNNALEIENTNLLAEHMDNTKQIAALRIALNHYRLAFFGLLTIVLAVLVFISVYKFVRKKRTKV